MVALLAFLRRLQIGNGEVNLALELIDSRDMHSELVSNGKTPTRLTADELTLVRGKNVEIVRQA